MVSEQTAEKLSVMSRSKLQTSGFTKSVNEVGKIVYTRELKIEGLSVPNPPTYSVMKVTDNGDGSATVVQFLFVDGPTKESWHFSQTETDISLAELID